MSEWQDIATAPKDGEIILFYPLEGLRHDWNPQVVIGHWGSRGFWVFQGRAVCGYSEEFQPTHWMPLPPAPDHLGELLGRG